MGFIDDKARKQIVRGLYNQADKVRRKAAREPEGIQLGSLLKHFPVTGKRLEEPPEIKSIESLVKAREAMARRTNKVRPPERFPPGSKKVTK